MRSLALCAAESMSTLRITVDIGNKSPTSFEKLKIHVDYPRRLELHARFPKFS